MGGKAARPVGCGRLLPRPGRPTAATPDVAVRRAAHGNFVQHTNAPLTGFLRSSPYTSLRLPAGGLRSSRPSADPEVCMAEPEREAAASDEQPNLGTDAAAGVADPDALRAMLETARSETEQQRDTAEQYLNLLQRVQADFVNYKRRVEGERETQAAATRADTIRAFLPIVDDLQRALEHAPAQVAGESWVDGFRLI